MHLFIKDMAANTTAAVDAPAAVVTELPPAAAPMSTAIPHERAHDPAAAEAGSGFAAEASCAASDTTESTQSVDEETPIKMEA